MKNLLSFQNFAQTPVHCAHGVHIEREAFPRLPCMHAGPEAFGAGGWGAVPASETPLPEAGLTLSLRIILELVPLDKLHPFLF